MDIQKATKIFTNAEQCRHFTKQVASLNIQSSTNLTDFFNIITQNPLHWLNSLPKEAQSDDALRKYKTPLNTLLNNTEVKQSLGETFCDDNRKLIQKGYKDNIEQALKLRNNTMNIVINTNNEQNEPETTIDDSVCDSTIDNDSEPDNTSVLNIDELDYQNPKHKLNTDYQRQYETMKHKYAILEVQHKEQEIYYKSLVQILKDDKDQLMKLLGQLGQFTSK